MSRAAVLSALFGRLAGVATKVVRNESLPTRVPSGGMVIMRDGDPGEPVTYFGRLPATEHYFHPVEIEVYVQAPEMEADLYAIADAIGAALAADNGLSGLAEAVRVAAPQIDVIENDGGARILAALVRVTVEYVLPSAA